MFSLFGKKKQSLSGAQPRSAFVCVCICVCVFYTSVGFGLKWEQLMTFLENPSNWQAICKECQEAGVSQC